MGKQILFVFIGGVLIAIGINTFLIPHHLINGGMIGVGLISNYAFGVRPGLTIITLSLPLYIFAWFHFRKYFYNGIHGLLLTAFLIDLFHPLVTWMKTSILIGALAGGFFIGVGVSMLLLVKVSTGGGDLLALMIANVTEWNVGLVILVIDVIVITFGSIVLREATIIYSFIMIVTIGITTYLITNHFA